MEIVQLGLVFLVAVIYASVGHGGASGYLAVLSFFAVPAERMAAGALVLNLLVAGTAWIAFARAGYFRWRLVAPFLLSSVPFAFVGGWLHVPSGTYLLLLSGVLVWAGARLMMSDDRSVHPRPLRIGVALGAGAAIGFVSGVVGVGGGIFLSPLLLLMGWAETKPVAAASACFIVVNSAVGLAGRAFREVPDVGEIFPLVAAAFLGGVIGSTFGVQWLSSLRLRRILGIVLWVASAKMILKSLF